MRIVIVAGGVGGSRFTAGVRDAYPQAEITVVINTADDIELHGLHVSPDLDTVMYALGGGIDAERGWGRAEETWSTGAELAAYGAGSTWFNLGDRDFATHLIRTQWLRAGHTLTEVTARLCQRWLPGPTAPRLLPMTDDPVQTHVVISDPAAPDRRRTVHFQEYWVRLHARPEALAVDYVGIEVAAPPPGVLDALATADLILVAPSNPVVSVGPVLAVPGLRDAIRAAPAPVIGFSGVLGGAPVLGMAHRLLPAIGVEVDAAAVGVHYGARAGTGVLDHWVIDSRDADRLGSLAEQGISASATDLIMSSPAVTADFVRRGVQAARG